MKCGSKIARIHITTLLEARAAIAVLKCAVWHALAYILHCYDAAALKLQADVCLL